MVKQHTCTQSLSYCAHRASCVSRTKGGTMSSNWACVHTLPTLPQQAIATELKIVQMDGHKYSSFSCLEPSISFDLPQYTTDESDIGVKITIKRTGTDLSIPSSIFLRTKESEPTSAEGKNQKYYFFNTILFPSFLSTTVHLVICLYVTAMKDYIPVSQMIHFAPHVTTQSVHVTILDDTGIPKVEGEETFEVLLRNPIIARIGKTKKTIIVINDTFSDCKCLLISHFYMELFLFASW